MFTVRIKNDRHHHKKITHPFNITTTPMKKVLLPLVAIAILMVSAFAIVEPSEWQLTDGYSIRFSGKKVNGFFHSLKGKVNFDENKLSAASCNLEVQVASITTGNS